MAERPEDGVMADKAEGQGGGTSFLPLSEEENEYIRKLKNEIGTYAELTGSDLFIDCFYNDKNGVVEAHGRPQGKSLYSRNIEGEPVLSENEPMVFYTFRTGVPMNDGWAISQENRAVMQKTLPLRYNDKIIAVLIQERDDTRLYRANRKLERIEEAGGLFSLEETEKKTAADENSILIREVHHRIKNSLEIISSFLSMQKRQSASSETVEVLNADIAKIGSIAAMYDMMSSSGSDRVDAWQVIRVLADHMNELYKDMPGDVKISFSGEKDVLLPSGKLQALVLIVNELVQNAYKHGLKDGTDGHEIEIHLLKGHSWCAVNVLNNGNEYSDAAPEHMGLRIIRVLAEEELNGHFSIEGRDGLTTASVHFPV